MIQQAGRKTACQSIVEILAESGVTHRIHAHEPTRTMDDAERNLTFDMSRIVKTVAFQIWTSLLRDHFLVENIEL
jgi:hypothetical protein